MPPTERVLTAGDIANITLTLKQAKSLGRKNLNNGDRVVLALAYLDDMPRAIATIRALEAELVEVRADRDEQKRQAVVCARAVVALEAENQALRDGLLRIQRGEWTATKQSVLTMLRMARQTLAEAGKIAALSAAHTERTDG